MCVCVQVKLWRVCEPEAEQPSSPELTLQPGEGKLELVLFHPTSSGLLALGSAKSALIWDTRRQGSPLAGQLPTRTPRHVGCFHVHTCSYVPF